MFGLISGKNVGPVFPKMLIASVETLEQCKSKYTLQ